MEHIILFIEKKDNIMKIHVVKARDNCSGQTLSYNVDINRGYFVFIPESEESTTEENNSIYEKQASTDDEGYF